MFGIPNEPGVQNMTSPAEPFAKPSSTDRLIRRPEVEAMTGMSCSAIYRAMDAGKFPRPRRVGGGTAGAVAWLLSGVEAWVKSLPVADPKDMEAA